METGLGAEQRREVIGDTARERLLAGIPASARRATLAGVSTALPEAGDGPPLVLLHGGIGCGGIYWAPVIARLARRHRLIVPDAPGTGESDPVERLDPAAFGDWFAALLRETAGERPALVAHSLLGSYAARFAARRPDLLGRLVLYGAPGVGPYRMPLGLLVTSVRFDLSPSRGSLDRFMCWAFRDVDRIRRRTPEWVEAFEEYMVRVGGVTHVKRTMRQVVAAGTKQIPQAELGACRVPVALLSGRQDRMVPLRLAEGAASRTGWPLHVIDDAGHVPHIDRPEAFVTTLEAALAD